MDYIFVVIQLHEYVFDWSFWADKNIIGSGADKRLCAVGESKEAALNYFDMSGWDEGTYIAYEKDVEYMFDGEKATLIKVSNTLQPYDHYYIIRREKLLKEVLRSV